jgi:hypothetical protein
MPGPEERAAAATLVGVSLVLEIAPAQKPAAVVVPEEVGVVPAVVEEKAAAPIRHSKPRMVRVVCLRLRRRMN